VKAIGHIQKGDSMSYHTIILVGNLGKDPEMRYTPSGQAVTNFSVAINDGYTNSQGDRVDRTIWVRVSAWGKLAETCNQYLKKGRKVLVEGRLVADEKGNPRSYQRNDGTTGANFEITASTVRFLSSRSEGEGTSLGVGEALNDSEEPIPF
jgi:single-strand DNA-binding protein